MTALLGVDVSKSLKKRRTLGQEGTDSRTGMNQRSRRMKIHSWMRLAAVQYWTDHTAANGSRADRSTLRKKVGDVWEFHAKHIQQDPSLEMYTAFRVLKPRVTLSVREFLRLRPWWVRKVRNRYQRMIGTRHG